jgi:3-oxoacyl-[acyl-carrier-protein] synthase-3
MPVILDRGCTADQVFSRCRAAVMLVHLLTGVGLPPRSPPGGFDGCECGACWKATVEEQSVRHLKRPIEICGLGAFLPDRVLTNAALAERLDTSDGWIVERTGIRERRIADTGVATSDLACEASRRALANASLDATDLELIVVGTTTPDMAFPSTACLLQRKLGARSAWGFDLGAACSGFTFALSTAWQVLATGAHDRALVVGADVMSRIVDYDDRSTCVLFGDGAGSVVLAPAQDEELALLDFAHEIEGSTEPHALCMPAGGSLYPACEETVARRQHFVQQRGDEVFRFAVRRLVQICRRILVRNELATEDVDLFVCHQANRRIIEAVAERLGFASSQVIINVDRVGNTTAASIPLALADAASGGRLQRGSLVLLASVGAGFTIGSVLLRWASDPPLGEQVNR